MQDAVRFALTKKVVAAARGWETKRGVYKKVRDRLLRDLKVEAPPPK
jgi:hypothetical protein